MLELFYKFEKSKSKNMKTLNDKARGSLLGLAIGDALGTTIEFKKPGTFSPVSDIVGKGPFHLKAGEWTDDTSMALCLASSLVEMNGFDAKDQIEKYIDWYQNGYLSSNGVCFDIGNTVRAALNSYARTKNPYSGSTDTQSSGNGCIMRLSPVPLFYHNDSEMAIKMSAESSKTTHGSDICLSACMYMGGIICAALQNVEKNTLLSKLFSPIATFWDNHKMTKEIQTIANGSFKTKKPPEIKGTGYVVDCLEAALWAFYTSDSFEEGVLKAVNLGNDADTTGAVYGQIAGAYYGESGIPDKFLKKIVKYELITGLAENLVAKNNIS